MLLRPFNYKFQQSFMNMAVLPADPSPWMCGQYVKNELFQSLVMLHIKLYEITNAEAG